MRTTKGATRALLLAAGLVAALAVAGCGSDDDDGDDPSAVAIEATGSKGDVTFEAPAEADAGAAEITFTNSSQQEDIDGQLVYTSEDHTDEEVVAELGKAVKNAPVADWFQGGGGAGPTAPGASSTVTQELKEGTYYVVGNENPTTPLTKIEVSGDGGAELPDADATVDAVEYSFTGEDLKAGEQSVLLDNKGGTWHHFLAAQLKPDATIEQAKAFFESEGQPSGPPPFVGSLDDSPVSSTVLEGGTSQLVDVNLEPGKYAFFCFIADKIEGGPPHVAKGMVSEVTVAD